MKDLATTISGVIGFLAVIVNWVFTVIKVDFQIPTEIQTAIVGLAVLVVGYYTGKPNAPTPTE